MDRWVAGTGRRTDHTLLTVATAGFDMGERVCYLEFCPDCDCPVSIADDRCPDCGAPLDHE